VSRSVRIAGLSLGLLGVVCSTASAQTSWVQGRVLDQDGTLSGAGTIITLGSGGAPSSAVGGGFYFVIDELQVGSTDQFCVGSAFFGTTCGETRYISWTPAVDQQQRIVSEEDIDSWRLSVGMEGDGTLGEVFGIVEDASGMPVAGADIVLDPPSGTPYYLDEDGSLDAAGPTYPNGRFLVLDMDPGEVLASADVGGAVVARAHGAVTDRQTAFLTVSPTAVIGGIVVDEAGNGIAGATVSWDFDVAVSTTSAGGGSWTLGEVLAGIDRTVRATAPGFKEASTFRRSEDETADPSAIEVRMLSTASYASIPDGFGIVQDPLLGMAIGRVLDADGTAATGAVVSVEPSLGTVRYFDAAGQPDPSLLSTSSAGSFAVFNIPTGNVVLSAVAPGALVRSIVAPSLADAVTQGDLHAYETQTVTGAVFDETLRDQTVGNALVQVVEFPSVATLSDPDGSFELTHVPRNTLISLRAAKAGFVDTYTFRRDSGPAPARVKDLFLVSENSVVFLYASLGLSFDRSRALIGAQERLSNGDDGNVGDGIVGLQGESVPRSGVTSYPGPDSLTNDASTVFGNINILSVDAGEGGVVAVDPRSDFSIFELAAIRANGAVIDEMDIPCDESPKALSPLYPCEGDVIRTGTDPMDFHWDGDGTGSLKFQVQFSSDENFTEIAVTSKKSDRKFIKDKTWRPGKKKWRKKILPLADLNTESKVYWRIQQRQRLSKKEKIDTFSTVYSFTVK
jgi:hypothetical protein